MQKNYYAIIPANVRYDEDLPANAKLLYGEITALCNEKGYCWASNSYFSDLYKIHNKSISRLISQLDKKGYIKIEMILEGKEVKSRHIYLPPSNTDVTTPPQKGVEGSNEIVTTPSNKNVTENNTSINNTNNNAYSNDFEQFWSLYPRRVDKKKAYKSFKTAVKNHPVNIILDGTKKYAQQVQKTEKQYIKHPSTFLNNESFIDGYEQPSEQPILQPYQEEKSALDGFWGIDDY